jgi:hypothetical protein
MTGKPSKKKQFKRKPSGGAPLPHLSSDHEDWEAKEARLRSLLVDQAKRALKLRSKEREFHGLDREFRDHQAQMLVDYERTKDLKHPRDLGDTRERILWKFLSSSGYLPARYAVSDRSVRVVSTTGHMSRELDIALYDKLDAVTLMNREEVYQVLPLESVYGVIQIKSRLTAATIQDGLKNIASFKSLNRQRLPVGGFTILAGPKKADRGFGLLFAYESALSLAEIMAEIKNFSATRKQHEWANFIFVLNQGFVFHGEENAAIYANEAIEAIRSLQMQGRPDREGFGLFTFYSLLLALLRGTETKPANVDAYFSLPFVADEHSYRFSWGNFREFGVCPQHGDFARKIAPDKLKQVIDWCRTSQPINWVKAHHIAYGQPEDEAAYIRQPGEVYIYNPQRLPLRDILTAATPFGGGTVQSLAYDAIETQGMNILIPFLYTVTEGIISDCPKCGKEALKPLKATKNADSQK